PFDARLTRVILPWQPPLRLHQPPVGDFEPPRREQLPRLRMLSYGSSITQGNGAITASGTYASRVSQLLGVDFINLGFGGGAHLEREMADYIASRTDWDLATLEMGINMGRLGYDLFHERVGP